MKIVISKCYGGFGISPEAALWLLEKGFNEKEFKYPVSEYYSDYTRGDENLGFKKDIKEWRNYLINRNRKSLFLTYFSPDEKFVLNSRPENRAAPLLVECVETLGEKANGWAARLEVIEIPDNVQWEIAEYDGYEHIAEVHRTWS